MIEIHLSIYLFVYLNNNYFYKTFFAKFQEDKYFADKKILPVTLLTGKIKIVRFM